MSLNVKTSIVDYLKSQGQDSSYNARKKLASQFGITNYTGSAGQNTQLLSALQSQAAKTEKAAKANTSNAANKTNGTANAGGSNIAGSLENIYNNAMDMGNAVANVAGGLSADQAAAANNNLDIAQLYADAIAGAGAAPQFSANGQIDALLAQINSRPAFSYDQNTDPTFQQYKDQYTAGGNKAMRDTMGNGAALTGGYGNSYATTAGSQAYDAFMEQLNNKGLELRQNALNEYNQQTEDLYNQLNAAMSVEDRAYQQYLDQYNQYRDRLNLGLDQANAVANQWNSDRDYEYKVGRDAAEDAYRNATLKLDQDRLDWQKETDKRDYDYKVGQDEIANQIAMAKALSSGKSSSGSTKKSSAPSWDDIEKSITGYLNDMTFDNDQIKNLLASKYGKYIDENSESYDEETADAFWSLIDQYLPDNSVDPEKLAKAAQTVELGQKVFFSPFAGVDWKIDEEDKKKKKNIGEGYTVGSAKYY